MEVAYTHNDYREMIKEVLLINKGINDCVDILSSEGSWQDVTLQANAAYEAIQHIDRLKNFLVQINFITCNAASGLTGKEMLGIGDNNDSVDNSDTVSDSTGNDMELCDTNSGSETVLETSKSENVSQES